MKAAEKLSKLSTKERCLMMERAISAEEELKEISVEYQDLWEYLEDRSAKGKKSMKAKETGSQSRGGGGWPSIAARSP